MYHSVLPLSVFVLIYPSTPLSQQSGEERPTLFHLEKDGDVVKFPYGTFPSFTIYFLLSLSWVPGGFVSTMYAGSRSTKIKEGSPCYTCVCNCTSSHRDRFTLRYFLVGDKNHEKKKDGPPSPLRKPTYLNHLQALSGHGGSCTLPQAFVDAMDLLWELDKSVFPDATEQKKLWNRVIAPATHVPPHE